jgi:cytochrome b6-f complex iron-sulfur subunit
MILILAADCPQSTLDEVLEDARRLGWQGEVSRGTEQTVVALSGSGDAQALEEALARRGDVELVPLLERGDYRRAIARRRFMGGLVGGLGALTAVAAGLPVVGFLLPPRGSLSDPNLVRGARHGEVAEQDAKLVSLLGQPIWLVRTQGESYFALSAICTHMDVCQLEWSAERLQLLCPCHGAAFDLHGNVVQGPASIPLRSFPVDLQGQDVLIRRQG